jgi:hypothetical protein
MVSRSGKCPWRTTRRRPVIGELVGMAAEQGGYFGLDRLRQQRSRPVAQHLGQRIGECPWLGELENIAVTNFRG